jgi:hypothetical protein
MSKPEDFKFDSRVRDRLLRNRTLSSAEVKLHLEQLPDLEGEYEVMSETPQPAVAPVRSEVSEEPIVFEGIRRLQALSDVSSNAPSQRYSAPAPVPAPSSGLPSYREPEARALGTPLRAALMESEISGVGAGAVSAALGAMAAEARHAAGFASPTVISHSPTPFSSVSPLVPPAPAEAEPPTPVTLRSEAAPQRVPVEAAAAETEEEDDEDDEEDEDDDIDDDGDIDADDVDEKASEGGVDAAADTGEARGLEASEPDGEDVA